MGDRANVYVHHGDRPGVYLYTHGNGYKLPEVLREALAREERWDDDQYLSRIIFSEMIKDDIDGSTGYGISAYCGDGSDKILDVDTMRGTVSIDGLLRSFREYIREPRKW